MKFTNQSPGLPGYGMIDKNSIPTTSRGSSVFFTTLVNEQDILEVITNNTSFYGDAEVVSYQKNDIIIDKNGIIYRLTSSTEFEMLYNANFSEFFSKYTDELTNGSTRVRNYSIDNKQYIIDHIISDNNSFSFGDLKVFGLNIQDNYGKITYNDKIESNNLVIFDSWATKDNSSSYHAISLAYDTVNNKFILGNSNNGVYEEKIDLSFKDVTIPKRTLTNLNSKSVVTFNEFQIQPLLKTNSQIVLSTSSYKNSVIENSFKIYYYNIGMTISSLLLDSVAINYIEILSYWNAVNDIIMVDKCLNIKHKISANGVVNLVIPFVIKDNDLISNTVSFTINTLYNGFEKKSTSNVKCQLQYNNSTNTWDLIQINN